MRAVLVREFGGPEQLRLDWAADPVAGPGQVRVAVRAAGINPVDAGNRTDGSWARLNVPCILGYDIAGVIDEVGPGVSGLAPGDRVMAMTHFPDGATGYAELAVIDASLAAPISAAVLLPTRRRRRWPRAPRTSCCRGSASRQAAGCWCLAPVAALGCSCCNWQQERDRDDRGGPPGDAYADARPGRCGLRRLHLRRPRAAHPGAGRRPGRRHRRPHRRHASAGCLSRAAARWADRRDRNLRAGRRPAAGCQYHLPRRALPHDGDRTRALAALLDQGALRPVISHVFPLAQAGQAHRILEGRHAGGKIVLDVSGN